MEIIIAKSLSESPAATGTAPEADKERSHAVEKLWGRTLEAEQALVFGGSSMLPIRNCSHWSHLASESITRLADVAQSGPLQIVSPASQYTRISVACVRIFRFILFGLRLIPLDSLNLRVSLFCRASVSQPLSLAILLVTSANLKGHGCGADVTAPSPCQVMNPAGQRKTSVPSIHLFFEWDMPKLSELGSR